MRTPTPSLKRWSIWPSTAATPGSTTRITGQKDLVRLPGIVAAAFQHETSRAGDPHLHTHVLLPNRQARADGELVSLDGTSLVSRSQGRRHRLPSHPAPRTDALDRPGMGTRSIRTPAMADIAGSDTETI